MKNKLTISALFLISFAHVIQPAKPTQVYGGGGEGYRLELFKKFEKNAKSMKLSDMREEQRKAEATMRRLAILYPDMARKFEDAEQRDMLPIIHHKALNFFDKTFKSEHHRTVQQFHELFNGISKQTDKALLRIIRDDLENLAARKKLSKIQEDTRDNLQLFKQDLTNHPSKKNLKED